MKLAAIVAAVVLLTACAQTARVPVDVSVIPDDCANRVKIVAWLTELANQPRTTRESIQDYENARSQIKARIWRIRYRCQPV